MGQQVPFETLDGLAHEVADVAEAEGRDPTVTVEQVILDDEQLAPRAEVSFKGPDDRQVIAHFYEAYWAPLTEGKINLLETIMFLFGAGWTGLKFAVRGVFDRWMFGGRQEFKIRPQAINELFLAWWAIALLSLIYVGWAVFALALGCRLLGLSWPARADLVAILAADGGAVASLLLVAVVGFLVSRFFGRVHLPLESVQSLDRGTMKASAVVRWSVLGASIAAGLASVVVAVLIALGLRAELLDYTVWREIATAVAVLIGVGLVGLGLVLVQFPGDVAIYVSSYKVSRFQDTRKAIQETGRRLARFIYGLKDGPGPTYDEVLIVGHSLGSVVAYDTLNDAINRDLHPNGWSTDSTAGCYSVVQRTPLLLTFGCPLDKTAFIFRTQEDHEKFEIREGLAASMQPLIVGESFRPRHWVNVWSRWDWVSGELEYYDRSNPKPDEPKRVLNVEAKGSKRPDRAHTGYWTAPVVRGVVYAVLTGALPRDVNRCAVATETDMARLRDVMDRPVMAPAGAVARVETGVGTR
jgi:hypothetical protein